MIKTVSSIIFLLPVLTVSASYLISAFNGHVEWCLPLTDGCTSISKVGRYGLSFYLYKFILIPVTFLIMYFWIIIYKEIFRNLILLSLSLTASVFLILYLLALGYEGIFYRFMREIGIFIFFLFMPASQIILVKNLNFHKKYQKYILYLLTLAYPIMVFVYFLLLPLDNSNYENVLEWNFALIIFIFFPIFSYVADQSNVRMQ